MSPNLIQTLRSVPESLNEASESSLELREGGDLPCTVHVHGTCPNFLLDQADGSFRWQIQQQCLAPKRVVSS